jgi:hypothetical protein
MVLHQIGSDPRDAFAATQAFVQGGRGGLVHLDVLLELCRLTMNLQMKRRLAERV